MLGWPRVSGVVLEGGTLTSSDAGLGRFASTAVVPSGAGCGGRAAGGGFVGTLLGPEGADPVGGWRRPAAGRGASSSGPSRVSHRRSPVGGRVGWGRCGVVAGCWLRTAQWTRASFLWCCHFGGGASVLCCLWCWLSC